MEHNINRVKQHLQKLEAQPDVSDLKDASIEELEDKVEGLLPIVEELAEGCTLTIAHYGNLSNSTLLFPSLFGISDTKRLTLAVPPNSEGTLFITSIWQYQQERFKITPSQVVEPAKARRVYEFGYDYTVNNEGKVDLKTSISRETIHEWDVLTTLFAVESVTTQASGDNLTIQGGTMTSQPFLDKFQKQVIQRMRQGLRSRSWTVGVGLVVKVEKPKPSGKVQELVFEKENQAVLSSDERSVCIEWWRRLDDETKEAIRNQKLKIRITGYASPPGSSLYNVSLAEKRADHVYKMLIPKIGRGADGKCLAIVNLIGDGEEVDDPRRYVKIEILRP